MTRVLVSVAGSAGDLFPLVPVVQHLQAEGHDVHCAVVPRSLAFSLRLLGIPASGVGAGGEADLLQEPGAVTTRFGGWASLRHLALSLLGGTLDATLASLEELVATWRPDVIVSASFMPGSRILARQRSIEHVEVSIYPLMARLARGGTRFAPGYRRRCASRAGLTPDQVGSDEVTRLAWGVGEGTIMLHDPSLLPFMDPALDGMVAPAAMTGFPSWDQALFRTADVGRARQWLERSSDPVVLVTMGSYLGLGRRQEWRVAAEAVAALGVRGLFIGPVRELEEVLSGVDGDFHTARYLPLSEILGDVDVLVHHGGLGTMMSALRAGTPSVARPIAFDQAFNADLIERAGAGVRARDHDLHDAVATVLATPRWAERCRAIAGALVPPGVAAERAAGRITAAVAGSRSG